MVPILGVLSSHCGSHTGPGSHRFCEESMFPGNRDSPILGLLATASGSYPWVTGHMSRDIHRRPESEAAQETPPGAWANQASSGASGAYSLAWGGQPESTVNPTAGERLTPDPVAPEPSGLEELRRLPIAAMSITADRRLVSSTASARRLLELRVGFELDAGTVRCTDPDQATRLARLVHEAVQAGERRRDFHSAFELRPRGARGWLDVVVASHPEEAKLALLIVRVRP